MQIVLQNLHQNSRYARFFLAISRFRHDIDVNYVGFCSKILYLIDKTSRTSNFDAEKWFFCASTTFSIDLRVNDIDFHHYLYSQHAARWRLG